MMKISVAICTWNRCGLLRRTLDHFTGCRPPEGIAWELVVVNNNSTDATDQVIREFESRLPIVSVFEPQPGHSAARNRAVDTASGDYLIWTDNDVLVDPGWLTAYAEAFRREPEAAFFGGPIEALFDPPGRPEWLEATWGLCQPVFATRLLGDEPLELHDRRLPYGANYALRMDVQRRYRYDTGYGRVGEGMVGEDETSLLRQVARDGGRGRWVPDARIQHLIPGDRATESYVRRYFVGQGQTNVRLGKQARPRRAALQDACVQAALYRVKRPFAEPDEWVSHMIRSSLSWGEYREQAA